ncbi:MAG TPA: DUF6785 family protein [Planctomycetota bacterium]|nr:DUF6785 family protein [Planctomycetota bacterium]
MAVVALVVTSILVQVMEVRLGLEAPAEHALSVPAVIAFLIVAGILTLIARVAGPLVDRPRLLCICYALLCAAPLMTQGFWHRVLGLVASVPRQGQAGLADLEAMGDAFWPHGDDALAGVAPALSGATAVDGGVRLAVSDAAGEATATFTVAVSDSTLAAGRPCLIDALVLPRALGPTSYVFCRLRGDDGVVVEAFRATEPAKPSAAHPDGAVHVGAYGVRVPAAAERIAIEIGLHGPGEVELRRARALDVAALEWAITGRPDAADLPAGALVPWRDWARPLAAWGGFIALLFAVTWSVNVLMRRQWIEHERYALPMARVPAALCGLDERGTAIWRERWLWAGFAIATAWCLLRYWHRFDPRVPDLGIKVPLASYLGDPGWGGMFAVEFTVSAIFVAMALFVDANALASLVVGFWLFRALGWAGEATGAKADPDFPWRYEQQIGGWLAYAGVCLLIARRHLARVARIVVGREAGDGDERGAYRGAATTLAACAAGACLWAQMVGVSVLGALAFGAFLALIGLVAAKLRAECGLIFGYFAPYKATLALTAIGGVGVFGAPAVMFCFLASFMIGANLFHVAGAQLELLELGRRHRVRGRALAGYAALGIAGGLLIGGWAFLSDAYGIGGEELRYAWAFTDKIWYFGAYRQEVAAADALAAGTAASASGSGAWAGYAGAALATALVAAARQFIAGFWFHPMGVVMSSSFLMEMVWGSCLVALAIRASVARFGGAEAVRLRLLPFAMGAFLGGALTYVVATIHAMALASAGIESWFAGMP